MGSDLRPIIPNIVTENQLAKASSADQFIFSFCSMVGMIISGILFNFIGIFAIFFLNAVSYFISGVLEALVQVPPRTQIFPGQKLPWFSHFKKRSWSLEKDSGMRRQIKYFFICC